MPAKIPPEKLLEDLRQIAKKLGRTPTLAEYANMGHHNPITIRKNFGAWESCLLKAGLSSLPHHKQKWTIEDLQDELNRLEQELGHRPTYREMVEYGAIHPDTYIRRLDARFFSPSLERGINPNWSIENVPADVGNWIAGFVDGEGSFLVRNDGSHSFKISIRADDKSTLDLMKSVMDLPTPVKIYSNKNRRNKGQKVGDTAVLYIHSNPIQKSRIIPFFDKFVLRSKKSVDYLIYRESVLLACRKLEEIPRRMRYTQQELDTFAELTETLKNIRCDNSKAILT